MRGVTPLNTSPADRIELLASAIAATARSVFRVMTCSEFCEGSGLAVIFSDDHTLPSVRTGIVLQRIFCNTLDFGVSAGFRVARAGSLGYNRRL